MLDYKLNCLLMYNISENNLSLKKSFLSIIFYVVPIKFVIMVSPMIGDYGMDIIY